MSGATLQLADWVAGLATRDIPAAELRLARLRVLDTAALLCAGFETDAAAMAIDVAIANGGLSDDASIGASVIGRADAWRPAWAAFVHGVVAHCRDFDDTFPQSVVHPGSTIVSVALALGQSLARSDEDVLAAIVVGYEVAARLGAAGGRHLHAKGFHASGVYGPVIAAAVASRLLQHDATTTANALGLAGSMGGGLFEFLTNGSWSKWLHVGWSAFGGINAAQLAGSGFRGPVTALEGTKGFYAAFIGLDQTDIAALTKSLGHTWAAREAVPKYFPCAHVIQPYISGMLALRAALVIGDVTEVTCVIAPWAVPIVCEPLDAKRMPQTEMDVIASLPFLVGAALVDGRVTLDHLNAASRSRQDLRAAAACVTYRVDPTLGTGFAGSIEVKQRNAPMVIAPVQELALDAARLMAKFVELGRRPLGEGLARQLAERFGESTGSSLLAAWRTLLPSVRAGRSA